MSKKCLNCGFLGVEVKKQKIFFVAIMLIGFLISSDKTNAMIHEKRKGEIEDCEQNRHRIKENEDSEEEKIDIAEIEEVANKFINFLESNEGVKFIDSCTAGEFKYSFFQIDVHQEKLVDILRKRFIFKMYCPKKIKLLIDFIKEIISRGGIARNMKKEVKERINNMFIELSNILIDLIIEVDEKIEEERIKLEKLENKDRFYLYL